jgi:ferritin
MISKKMETALNQQIEVEAFASFLYLSMGSWCDQQSLGGCAEFFYRQSEEEREHMLKIFYYVNEVEGIAVTPAVKKPQTSWDSVRQLFEEAYAHEQKVTASIHSLVKLGYEEQDHASVNFLQWYVDEQREEEILMRSIIERIHLIGDGPQSLYYIDKEVAAFNARAAASEG